MTKSKFRWRSSWSNKRILGSSTSWCWYFCVMGFAWDSESWGVCWNISVGLQVMMNGINFIETMNRLSPILNCFYSSFTTMNLCINPVILNSRYVVDIVRQLVLLVLATQWFTLILQLNWDCVTISWIHFIVWVSWVRLPCSVNLQLQAVI